VKLAFVFPPGLLNGRTLDFTRLLNDKRGTTGSEITALTFPQEMSERGHNVTLFVQSPNAPMYNQMGAIVPLKEYSSLGDGSSFDAVLSVCIMNDIDRFREINPRCLRVCFQQVNDLRFASDGFDAFVDLYVSPSETHRQHMISQKQTASEKWVVVGNGVYPDGYPPLGKIPGRCVYLSSPDRGLHHLLNAWPEIHSAVPYSELRIFYPGLKGYLLDGGDPRHRDRKAAILRGLLLSGVTVVGGVSRNEMVKELAEAELQLYPCDPIDFTEGFSCSTLESCAAGALPILMDSDAMRQIYGSACPTAPRGDLSAWTTLALRALTVPPWAERQREKARALAATFAWPLLAKQLEEAIEHCLSRKRA
jgi:glycosyltransferase involved in cell wall biosynthesis